ncbi:MAG TPA: UvrD-helicase domain-containing protein [Bacteroidota bacterium]|nr:UvrD-helicase domain-containing protein [Bacteroidota bacterium]
MNYLHELNERQREAVECLQGPLTVVAGPGSGKTRVLTYRIAHLIRQGVPPYQILALTFTNKAAQEMKTRILGLVQTGDAQVWMGTFHSIFARILRREAEKIGYTRSFSIYDTADSLNVVRNVMSGLSIPPQQFNPQAMRSRISAAKNRMLSPEDLRERATDLVDEKAAVVFRGYQDALRQNNAMDFDDLLLKPIDLFRGHKKVLEAYQDRFRFILIDEYQDTNRAQYVLMSMLAERYRNICVVGDDAQSIYAFRGADIRNMLDFERDYPERRIVRLEQNYRSTGIILAAADRLIHHNRDQIEKHLWTRNAAGETIAILGCEDDRDEGFRIVDRIAAEVRSRKIDLNRIAIMYRTNAQSRSIEDALRRSSIPYTIVGGVEFYQRKEIKDILAYLRCLVNPRDNESVGRIMNYPVRGIGDRGMGILKSFAEAGGMSLLEAAGRAGEQEGLSKRALAGITAFTRLHAKYRSLLGTMSLSELTRSLVDELGILRTLKEEGTPEATARWENIHELLDAITEFADKREGATLEEFLQDVSLVSAVDEWDDHHQAVTLMTLHSAKGLEFPVVFITGCEEGILPLYTTSVDRQELEEERRLCYVGITRAMTKLYLTHARVRYRFGDLTYQTPSRFLEEIGSEGIETAGPERGGFRPSAEGTKPRSVRERKSAAPDHYHRDDMPDYENISDEPARLRVGGTVEHELFGRGKILTLAGSGETMKAVVEFESVGRKNLLVRYARLKAV